MPKPLPADPHERLARIQELVSSVVPTARCELQDYEFRIGCGDMDEWGNLHEFKLKVKDPVEEDHVLQMAKRLEFIVRTGGSTAG